MLMTFSSYSHQPLWFTSDSLHATFVLKRLGKLENFLCIKVKHLSTSCMLLTWSKHIIDLLARAKLSNTNGVSTPMTSSWKLSKHGSHSFSDPGLYRSMIGALQYVTLITPDIVITVNKACQFMASSLDFHWSFVKRIIKYPNCTITHNLLIFPTLLVHKFSLRVCSDLDLAWNPYVRMSTSNSCIVFGPNLVLRSSNT